MTESEEQTQKASFGKIFPVACKNKQCDIEINIKPLTFYTLWIPLVHFVKLIRENLWTARSSNFFLIISGMEWYNLCETSFCVTKDSGWKFQGSSYLRSPVMKLKPNILNSSTTLSISTYTQCFWPLTMDICKVSNPEQNEIEDFGIQSWLTSTSRHVCGHMERATYILRAPVDRPWVVDDVIQEA